MTDLKIREIYTVCVNLPLSYTWDSTHVSLPVSSAKRILYSTTRVIVSEYHTCLRWYIFPIVHALRPNLPTGNA